MYKECFGQTADRIGILWLKSKSRGVDRTGFKIKGKKWEMYESPRTQEENLEIFKSVKRIFDIENPKHKPLKTYPLPAPGAPAKIIALGPSNCSFKSEYSSIIYYKYTKNSRDILIPIPSSLQ